jgi:hypothetical protein
MLPSIRANCSVWDNTRSGLRTRRLPRNRVRRIPSLDRPTAGRAGWCRSWWHLPRRRLLAAAVGPVLVLPTPHPPRPLPRPPPNSNRSFANNCATNQPTNQPGQTKEREQGIRESLPSRQVCITHTPARRGQRGFLHPAHDDDHDDRHAHSRTSTTRKTYHWTSMRDRCGQRARTAAV